MRKVIYLLLTLLLVLAVAGCASKSAAPSGNDQPAPQETAPAAPDTSLTDYPPAPIENPVGTGIPGTDYPAPGGAPALESRATVKVELIEQSDDSENPAKVILKVKLVSTTPAEGSPDRFTSMVGQNMDMHANKEGLPSLSPGDAFTADVFYRGDEAGEYITAENIQK